MHSPMRAYIGVNEQAEPKLMERFQKGVESAHDLDQVVVREEIVRRRYDELCDFKHACIQNAIKTGK